MHNWKNKPQYFLLIKDGSLRFIRSLVSLSNCSVMQTSGSEQQRQTSLTWRTCAEHCFVACFLKSVYYSVRLRKDAAGPYKYEFVFKTVQKNKTHRGNLKGSAMPAVPAGFTFRRIRSDLQQSLIQPSYWASLCLSCVLDSVLCQQIWTFTGHHTSRKPPSKSLSCLHPEHPLLGNHEFTRVGQGGTAPFRLPLT